MAVKPPADMGKHSKKKPPATDTVVAPDDDLLSREYVISGGVVTLLQAFVIVIAGLWVFSPVFRGDWLWDDSWYLTNNPLMHDPARIWKAWFQPGSFVEYYPIEQTLQWWQWQCWHDDTLGYHLTNIGLHLLSALLVWRLFARLRLPLAWLGGLIFAVHPANVESVAWIAEFKTVLCLPPFLLAMTAWIDYEEHGRGRDYALALGFFLVAMLCKISMAPFPVVILLYAWWKRGRIGRGDLLASAPFFLVAVPLGLLAPFSSTTYWQGLHKMTNESNIDLGGLLSRLTLASETLSVYLAHACWPVGLLPVYPQWKLQNPSVIGFIPLAAFAGLAGWFWFRRTSWGRHALLGLGFFVLSLAPFLGFNVVSYMDFTWVMDHFLYLPMIGLIGLFVAALGTFFQPAVPARRLAGAGFLLVLVTLLAVEANAYAATFINEETLWSPVVQRYPDTWLAQDNLAKVCMVLNRPEEAKAHFEIVRQLRPDRADSFYNIGRAWAELGRFPEAIAMDEQALAIDPASAEIHNNLGIVLAQSGRLPEALDHFKQATLLKPDYALAYNNLGNALAQSGRLSDAVEPLTTAVQLKPDSAQAHDNLATVLQKLGRNDEARQHYQQALLLDPDDARARDDLAK